MKQKYTIIKNNAKNQIVIQEYSELDKEILSLLCEETYNGDTVKSALEKGRDSLISALRTPNMYPPGAYAERIAEKVAELYENEADEPQPVDIFFDDLDFLTREPRDIEIDEEIEEDEGLDDLLEDDIEDIEDDFDEKNSIDPLNSPLKIADDDSLETEDDG